MIALITLVVGFFSGVFIHMLTMKISFKQRTIDNKIKIYDSIITTWVRMRNEIFSHNSDKFLQLDRIYGESQAFIGEIFLVAEDNNLATSINQFNEKFYRQNWPNLDIDTVNNRIEELKIEAITLVVRMRHDIQESAILRRDDICHIIGGLIKGKKSV